MVMAKKPNKKDQKELILGSGSAIRKKLLLNAGLDFQVIKPLADEDALKQAYINEGLAKTPAQISAYLAKVKAQSVPAGTHDIVIGSDQVLEFEGRHYDKLTDLHAAKKRLALLSGKSHFLVGTSVLAQNGNIIWAYQSRARMRVRTLSQTDIEHYFERAGTQVLASVGCYEVEGMGINLFEAIEGDYFSILGLPVLPLLAQLRALNVKSA